ncbi:MAG: TetR/AcrR family transcriptional regulator [Polyangiales bacterium]
MRYTEEHKAEVRSRIVAQAARAFRANGLTGVAIPALMKRAGLTHGGFYRHFESRDELVAEALRAAFDETEAKIFGAGAKGDEPIAAVIDAYLTRDHRKHPALGCALAALGTEAPRQEPLVKAAFDAIAMRFLRGVEKAAHAGRTRSAADLHDDTLAIASAMLGALVLSRMLRDETLADRVLAATRRFLESAV